MKKKIGTSMKTFQLKEGYIQRKVADTEVLISVGENVANFNGYIELNSSAALLINLLKVPRTCEELEQALEETFSISHSRAEEDVLDFLKTLQAHDMVEVD
ncbi:MAG: PqqD family protein [Lachnospiraceae bacterium]|nr:PqqD family protein [Lachnospiraceae bacterium]